MNTPLITVFTPTKDRRPFLRRLYQSIQQQDYENFEWIIVDDGSNDGTRDEVGAFVVDARFPIRYFYQENAGKHIAINKGVTLAQGLLFFIVDSDDVLVEHALSTVVAQWESVLSRPDREEFAGVCGLRMYSNGSVIGGEVDYQLLDVSAVDYRFKLGYKGDRAEVIRTDIMKQYTYPHFAGERFCADALVWNRIAKSYRLRFFNDRIYVCEYLPGGITDTSVRLRRYSPQGACLYYTEMAALPGLTIIQRIKAVINFWRFARYDKKRGWRNKWRQVNSWWSVIGWPIGYLVSILDNSRGRK